MNIVHLTYFPVIKYDVLYLLKQTICWYFTIVSQNINSTLFIDIVTIWGIVNSYAIIIGLCSSQASVTVYL